MIHPSKQVNDGSASIGANQTLQTEWNTFRGPAGKDNFWIVWSATLVNELESAKNEALKHPEAGLTGQHLEAITQYLKNKDIEVDAQASRIKASQEIQVRKKNDLVLTLAQFEHR
jgi:hypothetical protein